MEREVGPDTRCSIARSLDLLGEKWTLLIVREAFWGRTRFSQLREALGIAPDVLSERLTRLVDAGVLERRAYRDAGARERMEYMLTPAGRQLLVVIAGLSLWGRENRPRPDDRSPRYLDSETGEPVELCFVTADGRKLDPDQLVVMRPPASPAIA
jgi:DNA-binding HxlR family transcriptional regulator